MPLAKINSVLARISSLVTSPPIVTERIFNINGVGGFIFRSINQRDGVSVVGAVTVLVIIFLLANLIVDLVYAVIDPRIRYS